MVGRKTMNEKPKRKLVLVLSVLGMTFAAFAALADHVSWLQAFCSGLSSACEETANFSLFRMPLWAWGMAFYAVLALSIYLVPSLFYSLTAIGIGFEASLVWVAFSMKAICIFCLGNLLVIILLIPFLFQKKLIWKILALSSLSFVLSMFLVPNQNRFLASGAPPASQPEIIAQVDGETINREDLETPLATKIYQLEMHAHKLKRRQIEKVINEKVLQREAGARGITVEQLIAQEAPSQGIEVSEAEVNLLFRKNLRRLRASRESPEQLRNRIRAMLRQRNAQQRIDDYAKSLYPKYHVTIFLEEPEYPYFRVRLEGSFSLGPPDAPVTIIEFSDYQCPACRKSHEVVGKVREIYRDRVKWVFKDYPLKSHQGAAKAAEAARCAGEQGHFWEYQDILFTSQEEPTSERLREYAARLGLNGDAFQECLDTSRYKGHVEQDVAEAKRIGIDKVPTFIIGRKLAMGAPALEQFREMIDEELRREQASP
jgi:predicted DsbA family dithiol-disulfide isomerase